jgi:Xaa-Pro aminopeptidase
MFRPAVFGLIVLVQAWPGFAGDNAYFAARRNALLSRIGESIAVLQGLPDTRGYVPFRQDNNFYYLTGVETPGAMLLLDGARRQTVLFLPARDEDIAQWEGERLFAGREAQTATGVDAVRELSEFGVELGKRLKEAPVLYTPLGPYEEAATSRDRALRHDSAVRDSAWDGRKSREDAFCERLRKEYGEAVAIKDLSPVLDEMRRIKDASEIGLLRAAGRIGALGLKEAMRAAKPGMFEYQISAVAEFVFLWHGASGAAYFPIVGSGPDSCILHYYEKRRRMESGDVVVVDFGPDYAYYAADITRTFPVSGRFSGEQAEAYRAVLEAYKAVTAAVRPGATFGDLDEIAQNALARFGYDRYTKHDVGHYVGMSVHDVGDSRPFEPGVVLAVEPGIYIPAKGLGVRIEDTVLVTGDGCEVLTGGAPKEIVEIEKLMATRSVAIAVGD